EEAIAPPSTPSQSSQDISPPPLEPGGFEIPVEIPPPLPEAIAESSASTIASTSNPQAENSSDSSGTEGSDTPSISVESGSADVTSEDATSEDAVSSVASSSPAESPTESPTESIASIPDESPEDPVSEESLEESISDESPEAPVSDESPETPVRINARTPEDFQRELAAALPEGTTITIVERGNERDGDGDQLEQSPPPERQTPLSEPEALEVPTVNEPGQNEPQSADLQPDEPELDEPELDEPEQTEVEVSRANSGADAFPSPILTPEAAIEVTPESLPTRAPDLTPTPTPPITPPPITTSPDLTPDESRAPSPVNPSRQMMIAARPGTTIPSGTVLRLRYPRLTATMLRRGIFWQDVLLLEQTLVDEAGNVIAAEGTEVIGRFELTPDSIRFVTQAIALGDRNVALQAVSGWVPIAPDSDVVVIQPNQIVNVRLAEHLEQ
ncbi:MAG: hypothetical protein VKL39_21835, partial [Leptolyngbyaceae bacterium]|nr:hypothetical protein [Leptolyngbyaceae bacterium]